MKDDNDNDDDDNDDDIDKDNFYEYCDKTVIFAYEWFHYYGVHYLVSAC